MNMGHEINAEGAWFATVTFDKQFLFFNSWKPGDQGYNPYWISAAVIDSLRISVGVKEQGKSPALAILHQNSPNPFQDQSIISFELFSPATISLEIMNNTGQPIKSVVRKQHYPSGKQSILFDGSGLPPGMYYIMLNLESGGSLVKKMIIFK